MLGAKSLDEFDILGLLAGLHKHAQMRLAFIQGFGAFPKATSKTIVNECILEDLLHKTNLLRLLASDFQELYLPVERPRDLISLSEGLQQGPQPPVHRF